MCLLQDADIPYNAVTELKEANITGTQKVTQHVTWWWEGNTVLLVALEYKEVSILTWSWMNQHAWV